ncbi:unnamed protein product, partial [Vitis vinifera]
MGNLFSSFLLILLISFFFSFTTSKTQNFLQRGSSLSVEDDSDDYITSPDKSFTCGFYGMGENAYWFSIWFTNSKERTVVWMANRNRPFNQSCSQTQQVKFLELPQTDYYGFDLNYSQSVSMEACRKICLDDCLCQGFAYRLTGEGNCYAKSTLFNGYKSSNFPGSLYLKLPVDIETPFRRFSYTELKKATNNFKVELGRGGFGAGRHRLVVYEHVENLSLDKHLFSTSYNGFEPKIADFGLAKLSQRGGPGSGEFSRIRGTKGYMAPEFVRAVKRKIQYGEDNWVEDTVDPRLKGKFSRQQATMLVEIGISCVEEDRSKRPTMATVVQVLLECEGEAQVQTLDLE